MTRYENQIDRRPFRSKAEEERQVALETRYQRLALPAVVAAVQHIGGTAATDLQKSQ